MPKTVHYGEWRQSLCVVCTKIMPLNQLCSPCQAAVTGKAASQQKQRPLTQRESLH